MYLRTLQIWESKHTNVILENLALTLARQAAFKKTKAKLDLLIDINMLLMIKKITDKEYFTLFINMQKLITTT